MKSLNGFLQNILIDLGMWCGTSTDRDLKTITARVEQEGLSFLTITLATFGSDFQKSLDQGFVGDDQFLGFSRTGGLPRFLGGFLRLVFDTNDGRLLDQPSLQAIKAIRQITLMWAKMDLDCTAERRDAALRKFIECEQDVRRNDLALGFSEPDRFNQRPLVTSKPDRVDEFGRIGRMLWANLLSRVDSRIYNEGVRPKHGPGATADQLRGNAKYNQMLWTRRLEDVFPHWENIIPSESFLERTDCVNILEPADEIPVKVITVRKTLKTPRIIAIEPTCMQYMQQGILSVMMEEIARDDYARNFVRFESQEPNQWLAREGSITGALATLDLSEASDRVSNQHVRVLLGTHRILREAVDATRSRKADVPGHGVIRLAKFASMGSALCFPMEALVFTTIVFVGIQKSLNRTITKEDVRSLFGKVRVYGDDIIVPVEHVQSVVEELEAFGLRVNRNKSFWTGKFRESCGRDYYDGYDVSIVRFRRVFPENRQHAEELISAVSLRNQLWKKTGFDRTIEYLDDMIGKIIPFPVVEETSALLGRLDYALPCQESRQDEDLHIPLVKGVVVSSKSPVSLLDDYGALMKWFLIRGNLPVEDKDHLQRAGRPGSVRIKTRWASPV